jgi:hypothetical protein
MFISNGLYVLICFSTYFPYSVIKDGILMPCPGASPTLTNFWNSWYECLPVEVTRRLYSLIVDD